MWVMNFRRYSLFLIVAILTFFIGVAAARLVGGGNPFPHLREPRRGGCRQLSALPAPKRTWTVYTVYRSDGTVVKAYEVDKTYGLERLGAPPDEAAVQPPAPIVVTDAPRPPR
jgi:hypothetical protein